MVSSNSPLAGARLKIERAKHHLRVIDREILTFIESEPYRGVADVEPETGDEVYRIKIIKEIPPLWSTITGDAIHNMRAALDLVATAVVVANNGNGNKAYFPFGNTPQHFAQKVKGASQAAVDLIRKFKRYKGGTTALWQTSSSRQV